MHLDTVPTLGIQAHLDFDPHLNNFLDLDYPLLAKQFSGRGMLNGLLQHSSLSHLSSD
jgi:hypothetical protein